MSHVILLKTRDLPYENMLAKAFHAAIYGSVNMVEIIPASDVSEITGCDVMICLGVRSGAKGFVDQKVLKSKCNVLIDIADFGSDDRVGLEDAFFYFVETSSNHPKGLRLPNFVMSDHLYPEQDEVFTIFVDHFLNRRSYLDDVFDRVREIGFPHRIFWQNHEGIIENPSDADLGILHDQRSAPFKSLNFEEIVKYYRKSHVFMATHGESLGKVAIETSMCGALVFCHQGTYPDGVVRQIDHATFRRGVSFDWSKVKELCSPEHITMRREKAFANAGFPRFQQDLLSHLERLIR